MDINRIDLKWFYWFYVYWFCHFKTISSSRTFSLPSKTTRNIFL